MDEEKKHPQAKKDAQDEGEAAPSKKAAADKPPTDDEVQAYGEPPDASGGG